MYERNEKLYMHKISKMEKVIPSFQYEFIILTLEPDASNEEEKKGHTNGARPLEIIIAKEEPTNLRGGKDGFQREAGGMKYVSEQNL